MLCPAILLISVVYASMWIKSFTLTAGAEFLHIYHKALPQAPTVPYAPDAKRKKGRARRISCHTEEATPPEKAVPSDGPKSLVSTVAPMWRGPQVRKAPCGLRPRVYQLTVDSM